MRTSLLKIILVVMLAALLASGLWWWVKLRPQSGGVQPPAGAVELTDEERCGAVADSSERIQCLAAGYAKWLGSVKQSAFELQDYRRCSVLPVADERDVCVLEFADAFPASDVCGVIADSARQADCQLRVTAQGNDFSACGAIPDTAGRDYCYASVLAEFAGGGEKLCPTLSGADGEYCWELFYTTEALRTADYDRCGSIGSDAGRQRCLEALPPDSDGDHLSDYLEQSQYGSDPKNPDTDRDGFTDGNEVKGGYNPNGSGKLPR